MSTFAVFMDAEGETFVRLNDGTWTRLEKGQMLLTETTPGPPIPLKGPPLKNVVSDTEAGRLERALQKNRIDNGVG